MIAQYPHEFHAVGNLSGCKHCHRMQVMLRGDNDCPGKMRVHIAELEAQLSAKSEWEASQHKLAARVRAEERAATAAWFRKCAASHDQKDRANADHGGTYHFVMSALLAGLAEAVESGKHHEQPTEPK